jgi:hypothetical protein
MTGGRKAAPGVRPGAVAPAPTIPFWNETKRLLRRLIRRRLNRWRKCGTKGMCDKCVEFDKKIEHYRLLAFRLTDQPSLDGIKELIERMQAQKAALHPEQAK